ncbi:hypothetical protein ROHU_009066 [Labeo rohita]|uniref:Uncharacterized protein n=1 Tax=Labeo rohita TaxID=84645 RepID=A0A498M3T8_LABRO|nr:hypothetical protein ROHU_009066 [Labeo rohita]
MLRKRSLPFPSSQVTWVARILLSTLGSPGEKEGEDPEKSVTEPEKEPVAGPAEEGGPGPSKNHSVPLSGPHAGPKWTEEECNDQWFTGARDGAEERNQVTAVFRTVINFVCVHQYKLC